jgi:putative phage-type endonuclease
MQNSNDVLGDRTKYIGGSDTGAILGISPFTKRMDLMFEKLGQGKKFHGNKYTDFGKEYEDIIIADFELRTGNIVSNQQGVFEEDTDYEDMVLRAHIDGELSNGDLLEIKTIGTQGFDKLDNGIPEHYNSQIQFYMYLAKRNRCQILFAERVNGVNGFEMGRTAMYLVEFDALFVENMLLEIERFLYELYEYKKELVPVPVRTIEELESLPLNECMELAYNIALLDKLKLEIDAKRAELLKEMVDNDIHSVENEYLKISVSPATVRKGAIDTAKMAKEGIDIEKYRKKDSNVKESIRITLRGAK